MFNAPDALACYAQVFDEEQRLDRLEGFASLFGPVFYGLPVNDDKITLLKNAPESAENWPTPDGPVRCFEPPGGLHWQVVRDYV